MDRADRTLRAQIGGLARTAKYGGSAVAAPAQKGFRAKFERQVDPHNELDPAERARRTDAAIRAHMLTLSLRSKRARQRAREAQKEADAADAELAEHSGPPDAA